MKQNLCFYLRLTVIRPSDIGYPVSPVTLQRQAFPTVDQYLASITINFSNRLSWEQCFFQEWFK